MMFKIWHWFFLLYLTAVQKRCEGTIQNRCGALIAANVAATKGTKLAVGGTAALVGTVAIGGTAALAGTAAVGGTLLAANAVGGAALAVVTVKHFEKKAKRITYKLWTEIDEEEEILVINRFTPTNLEKFSRDKRTIILIHGYVDLNFKIYVRNYFQILVNAFLKTGDYNIIGVDWSQLVHRKLKKKTIKNAVFVGKYTAALIVSLKKKFKGIYCDIVAHHFGTIVSAVIGTYVKGETIQKITGLAPQKIGPIIPPNFAYLNKKHAKFVEVFHESYKFAIAHRDVYIDSNDDQPVCSDDTSGFCSDHKIVVYFAIDVYEKGTFYKTTKCNSYEEYVSGLCKKGPKVPLYTGKNKLNKRSGKYFINIKNVPSEIISELKPETEE